MMMSRCRCLRGNDPRRQPLNRLQTVHCRSLLLLVQPLRLLLVLLLQLPLLLLLLPLL